MRSGSWRAARGVRVGRGKRTASSSSSRWEQPDPVPRSREDRLLLAGERLEAERDAKVAANRAYEDYRENGSGHAGPQARSPTEASGSRRRFRRGW